MKKRILSMLLAVVMLVSLLPASAMAAGIGDWIGGLLGPTINITQQPKDVTIEAGQRATFTITATVSGGAALDYFWCDKEKLDQIDFTSQFGWLGEISGFITGKSVVDRVKDQLADAQVPGGSGNTLIIRNAQKSMQIQCVVLATATGFGKMPSLVTSTIAKLTVLNGEACEFHSLDDNLIHHLAVQNDCATEGNLEYFECLDCGNCFLDEECTQKTTKSAVSLPKTENHELVYQPAKPGNCTTRSNVAYYKCSVCLRPFNDADGREALQREPLGEYNKMVHGEHISHFERKEPTCAEQGHIEYWQCQDCGECYTDAALMNEISKAKLDIDRDKTNHTNLKKIEAHEPTCVDKGNNEYYYCSGCEDYFSDSAGTVDTTPGNQEIGAKGHSFTTYSSDAESHFMICNVCQYKDKAEAHYGGVADCCSKAVCSVCSTEYGGINQENHSNVTRVNERAATAYSEGYSGDMKCLDCGKTLSYGQSTPKLCLHTDPTSGALKHVDAKEVSCKADGNIEYWYCDICKNYWSNEALTDSVNKSDTVIKKVEHLVNGQPNSDVAVMRSNPVQHWYECKLCNEEIIATRASHTWSEDAPTCTHGKHCTICGMDNGERDASRHVGATEVRDRIESVNGSRGYTGDTYCCDCGEMIAKGEVYYDLCWNGCKNLIKHNAVKASCTEDGNFTYFECPTCGKLYKDEEANRPTTEAEVVEKALGHDIHPGEAILTKPVTQLIGSSLYAKLYNEIKNSTGSANDGDILAKAKLSDLGEGNFCYDEHFHWLGCQRCGKTLEELENSGIFDGLRIEQSLIDKGKMQPHTGGTADCTHSAKCEDCGMEYGPLGTHRYNENNYCEVCGGFEVGCPAPIATVETKDGRISLYWNAVSGAESYQIYCSNMEYAEYTKVATVTGLSYNADFARDGECYYFKVRALGEDGTYGKFSNVMKAATRCVAPTIKSENDAKTGKIRLMWEPVAAAESYKIYRSDTKTGEYKLMYTTTSTSYTNTSANAGYTYYYKVKAVGAGGDLSEFSNMVYRTCDCAAPSVTSSNDAKTGKIKLTWKAVTNASKYEIWRADSRTGTFKKLYTTTSTSYTNTTSVAGYTYYYQVVAVNKRQSSANSAPSTTVERTCDCGKPSISVKLSNGDPKLSWSAVSGADKYIIYRATSQNGSYTKMYTTTKTSYTNTSAKSGTKYFYKVVAASSRSSYADSAYSNIVSIVAK